MIQKFLLFVAIASTAFSFSGCSPSEQDIQLEKQMHDEPAGEASPEAKSILNNELKQKSNLENLPNAIDTTQLNNTIPKYLYDSTMTFFNKYKTQFKNQSYIAMIDFKQSSSNRRLYVLNVTTGEVLSYLVAHGKNSDPDNDRFATQFSNTSGSLMSSVGAYMTAETYQGKNGYSMRLDGLQATNSNARSRAIVVHAAGYIGAQYSQQGRSYGCPALEPIYSRDLIDKLKGGALLFAGY